MGLLRKASYVKLIFIIGLIFSFCFLVSKGRNRIEYIIYSSNLSNSSINLALGIVPKSYIENLNFDTLLIFSKNQSLINVVDKNSSYPYNYILLTKEGESKFLKAYPLSILKVERIEELSVKNFHSYMIDLEVFNEYLTLAECKSRANVIESYCKLLSLIEKNEKNYCMVNSRDQLDSLVEKMPLLNNNALKGYNIVDYKTLIFDNNKSNEIYCWFINYGLLRIEFYFVGDKLNKVKTLHLGYLGNEYPAI